MGSHYCHLKLDERRKLAKWLEAKMPISEIADRLGRDPSTIYRDIKRNRYTDDELPELNGDHALVAQDKYEARRAVHRKMIVYPELKEAIEDRLKAGWSPEQIAGRMRLERHPIRVSHETIYRFAYSKDGRDEQFYRHLPEHRRRRRPRGYRRHNRTHIFDVQSLSHRPDRISERAEFGHWECDLMMFRKEHGKVNVTSLVERFSRYAVVMRNEDRQSKPIMEAQIISPGSPARRCASVDHLRSWHGVLGLEASQDRDRRGCMVLRSASAVSERHRGKHEQKAAEISPSLNRTDGADKSIFEVDLPPPQFHPTQVPGLSHPRRGL